MLKYFILRDRIALPCGTDNGFSPGCHCM